MGRKCTPWSLAAQFPLRKFLQVLNEEATSLHANTVDAMASPLNLFLRIPRLIASGALGGLQPLEDSQLEHAVLDLESVPEVTQSLTCSRRTHSHRTF